MRHLEVLINEKLEALDPEKKGLSLCVACSAGVDSTVLLHLLHKISLKKNNVFLSVCHVNYGLRAEESNVDEIFLKKLAEEFRLPFFSFRPEKSKKVHEDKKGIQVWARKERYQFFEELAASGWQIILAHTKDDLLETILQRISRGTSPLGVLGMSERHKFYWRPLLNVEKKSLKNYAMENEISWREDKSNSSRCYSRNKLRLDIIPELESLYRGSSQRILRFAKEARELAVFTRKTLRQNSAAFLEKNERSISIRLEFFRGLERGVVGLFLADLLREFAGNDYIPEEKLLSVLYQWITEFPQEKSQRQLRQDMFCKIQENKLIFEKLL
jgi:tRNA(Ile)-lysidine synthase